MSRFKSRPHPPPKDILTPGPDLPWELVGPGESYLLAELDKLYWAGVERELKNIIQTLRVWRRPEYSYISIPDETDDFIYGFDTFIDQVCQESREFAFRYGKRRRREDANKPSDLSGQGQKYEGALKQAFLDIKAERSSMRIRGEVRNEIKNLPKFGGLELLAAMLLQSAGFLDIDKITEYRPPRSKPRPGIPQLTLTINEHSQPEFHPLHCSACNAIIYDSMFTKQPPVPKVYTICSDCYWAQHYGDSAFVKVHKHSVLHTTDTSTSGRLCQCESVPHFDSSGRPRSLFPLNPDDRHITSGKDRCPLLDLAGMVSHAKYRGLLSSVGMKPRGSESGSVGRMIERVKSITLGRADRMKHESQVGTGNSKDMNPTASSPTEDDIPAFFRHRTETNPFGDEHMGLRIGPLIIENGVESTKSGALITLREPPVFHERFEHAASQPALAVDGTPERLLWQQSKRPVSQPKRYKAMMKQVVGVPFSGSVGSEQDREQEIARLVLEASQSVTTSSETNLQQDPNSRIPRILDKLQDLLLPRVRVYLSSIASQLLNPSATLTWNPTTNTCHSFCASLLDPTLFTPLVNGPSTNPNTNTNPLYLVSFYTPSPQPNQHSLTSTPTPIPRTKHDIPPGHIQESFIQPFTSPSSDLIDSLTHYSTDWASFPRPLYPHQSLFPWDCTEGYARCPMPCGGCNLSKHVWAFPFDSWSLVSLHLGRERYLYPALQRGEYNHIPLRRVIHTHIQPADSATDPSPSPNSPNPNPTLEETHETRKEWIQIRLSILHASWTLARTASGMARSPTFQKSTAWIHTPLSSSSSFPPTATIKMGGIHRAQPNSHYFERGTNAHYFLSTWAGKPPHEQQREYEALQGERMRMEDVMKRGFEGRFYASSSSSSSRDGSSAKAQGWTSRGSKKKDKGSGDRSYNGFEGEDSTRFTGNLQIFYHSTYTPGSESGSGDGGSECVDAQFGSIVGLASIGQFGGETGYDPAMDPGVNCASGCGSSSMPSGGESGSGGGGGGGGGWGDGGGSYSGGGSSGGGDGGGGSSGGGDGGGGGGGGGDGGG